MQAAKLLFVAALAALLAGLALRLRRRGWLTALAELSRGLMWQGGEGKAALMPADHLLLWLAHAGGLACLWRLRGYAYPAALPLGLASAALLVLPQWPALLRGWPLDAAPLTALVVPYLAGLFGAARLLPAQAVPGLLAAAELGAVAHIALAQIQRTWGSRRLARGVPPAALLLLVAAVGWALVEYLGGRTQGVTGSDPYCYVQMAVDLARQGDPRHVFALFPLVRDLGIPWYPVVHVGYHLPTNAAGLAPTVWPIGWPALLSLAYRLLGERGLYLAAPAAGLLALVGVAALAAEVWPQGRPGERWLGVALAVAILATAREQVLQLLVPMADVPAQLFSLVAVWLALRAASGRSWALAALAGGALGVAYDIRHTQVALVPVVALALWPEAGGRQGWKRMALAGAGAVLAAAPDLWYHQVAFGGFFHPESPELSLIGLRYWWGNARHMAGALAAAGEFGWLLPLLVYGLWRLWREQPQVAAVLCLWIAINAGSQFLYGPLRWRDLLAIVPPLAVLTAYGAIRLVAHLRAGKHLPPWAAGWAALGIALLLALRTTPVLAWPGHSGDIIFGYLSAEHRQAFAELGEAIEGQAVVGTSLNSGAVELYTGCETFRPGDWTAPELDTFLAAMARAGKPVYILDDGNEHAGVLARLGREGRLVPLRRFSVWLYGDPAHLTGMLYRVRTGDGSHE